MDPNNQANIRPETLKDINDLTIEFLELFGSVLSWYLVFFYAATRKIIWLAHTDSFNKFIWQYYTDNVLLRDYLIIKPDLNSDDYNQTRDSLKTKENPIQMTLLQVHTERLKNKIRNLILTKTLRRPKEYIEPDELTKNLFLKIRIY
jgi:hypothetical protein